HQRQLDTFSIDPEVKVSSVQSTPEGLEVVWPANNASSGASQRHRSVYPWEWLQNHPPFIQAGGNTTTAPPKRQWTHVPPSTSTSTLPNVPFDSIMSRTSHS